MKKINIIEYIIDNTELKQRDIAEKLGVSRGQISKWKAGEFIPPQRHETLNELAGLDGIDLQDAIIFETKENQQAWTDYIVELCEYADCFISAQIADEPGLFTYYLISHLSDLGFNIKKYEPRVSNKIEDDEVEFSQLDMFFIQCIENISALNNWFYLFIELNHDFEDLFDIQQDLNFSVYTIGLMHIEDDLLKDVGIDLDLLKKEIDSKESSVRDNLAALCHSMNERKLPLMTDYFDYINEGITYLMNKVSDVDAWRERSSEAFLPYADQLILAEIRKNNELLMTLISQLTSHTNERRHM